MEKSNKRILLVDDDELLREILASMLSDYTVIEADNGRTAVQFYKMYRPDIILMDIMMPIMDGIMATREILDEDPNAIVLAITAFTPLKGDDMLKAGAKEIITKPITKKKLIEVVEKYLNAETVL